MPRELKQVDYADSASHASWTFIDQTTDIPLSGDEQTTFHTRAPPSHREREFGMFEIMVVTILILVGLAAVGLFVALAAWIIPLMSS